MKITQSYKCKLINVNKSLDDTKDKLNFTEKLMHKTKNSPCPKYSFAKDFYKFPSYLRRDAISQTIGVVEFTWKI